MPEGSHTSGERPSEIVFRPGRVVTYTYYDTDDLTPPNDPGDADDTGLDDAELVGPGVHIFHLDADGRLFEVRPAHAGQSPPADASKSDDKCAECEPRPASVEERPDFTCMSGTPEVTTTEPSPESVPVVAAAAATTQSAACPECGGSGRIVLLTSVKACPLCTRSTGPRKR